jgi:hypothetical protein
MHLLKKIICHKMFLDSEIHLNWMHIIDENYIASIYKGM